jgi:hypothetical protein
MRGAGGEGEGGGRKRKKEERRREEMGRQREKRNKECREVIEKNARGKKGERETLRKNMFICSVLSPVNLCRFTYLPLHSHLKPKGNNLLLSAGNWAGIILLYAKLWRLKELGNGLLPCQAVLQGLDLAIAGSRSIQPLFCLLQTKLHLSPECSSLHQSIWPSSQDTD